MKVSSLFLGYSAESRDGFPLLAQSLVIPLECRHSVISGFGTSGTPL